MIFKETPAIVFAGMNILVVILGVLSGIQRTFKSIYMDWID
jgi:hypothetical protein